MLPLFARGSVAHGFGRGSKQLGIPTANLPDCVVENLPPGVKSGVYFGWASVRQKNGHKLLNGTVDGNKLPRKNGITTADTAPVYPSVASIGWNPFFKNTKRTLEVHILHTFESDFYGAELRVCLAGYIRDELNFTSRDELISAIEGDIKYAKEKLQEPCFERLRSHDFFITAKPPVNPFVVDGGSEVPSADSNQQQQHLEVPCDHSGCARHDD